MSVRSTTVCTRVFTVSTIGDSLVTVIDSCTEPGGSVALTVAVNPVVNTMFPRFTTWKPGMVKVTA